VRRALFILLILPIFLLGGKIPSLQAADYLLKAEILVKPSEARQVEIWIPLPLEDESQKILALKIEAPGPFLIEKEEEYGNRFLYLIISGRGARLSYQALIRRKEFQPSLASPPSPRLLLPDRLVPLKPFSKLAAELASAKKNPLEKLKAFYDYVVENLRYDKSGKGWGRGDALFACSAKRGNCTDFHSLLMALARGTGIPVFFEIGLPIPPKGGKIKGYHCWLKAYVRGKVLGLDASEASKHPEKKAYFFGHLDEKRILLARGRDILLAPPQHGPRLNFIYQAYAEADLKPAPELVKTTYSVKIIKK